ncbi:unnamed protein product [Bubo scandiacus]
MRGAGGTREPPGPGLGSSSFGAAPAACPWGCVLGPGGWSGAPFCPWHRLPAEAERSRRQLPVPPQDDSCPVNPSAMWEVSGARDAFSLGPGVWYCPGQLEESSEEEEEDEAWLRFSQPWDVSSEDSDPPYNFCGFKKSFLCEEPPRAPPSALEVKLQRLPVPWGHQLTAEEAERNARELVAEEERMKRKAEKKKLKRKKQKDRKKREKLGQELQSQQEAETSSSALHGAGGTGPPQTASVEEGAGQAGPSPSPCLGGSAAASGEEEMEVRAPGVQGLPCSWAPGPPRPPCLSQEELDLSCTFVFKARQKAGVRLLAPGKEKPARSEGAELGRRPPGKVSWAPGGFSLAPRAHAARPAHPTGAPARPRPRPGHERGAAEPDSRRSWQRGRPKGPLRRGSAGLHRGREAEPQGAPALWEPLVLLREAAALRGGAEGRTGVTGAAARLAQGLLPQGQGAAGGCSATPRPPAPSKSCCAWMAPTLMLPPSWRPAGPCCGNAAPGAAPGGSPCPHPCWRLGSHHFPPARGQGRPAASSQQTLPPTHPARDCFPLWVGYGTPGISEKVLQSCFGRFGEIRFIRVLPERHCAFINYTRKKAAEAAYTAMQDAELEGSRLALQLKHPSHATPSPRRHPEPWGEVGAPPGGLL